MRSKLLNLVIWVLLALSLSNVGFGTSSVMAIYDPLIVPNNKYGVHILEPGEIADAAKLVNTQGGDWGYVTVPIRSNDRDTEKWTEFFKKAGSLHIIPILRITTYPDRADWTAPTANDLVDFANFLNGLPWPTKNRYIVLFNEPNHSQEWGGYLSPLEYANLITESSRIFKSRNVDFFLISAGLDMSAPQTKTSLDALYYIRELNRLRPKWFDSVDGLAFHAYPNPAFSAPTFSSTRFGPKSYTYELDLLYKAGLPHDKPIFITETGTVLQSDFYKDAFTFVWTEQNIVAVTPFILFAGSPDFEKFSLLDKNHSPKNTYNQIYNLTKIPGSPLLSVTEPTPFRAIDLKPGGSFIREPIPSKSFSDLIKLLRKFFNLFKKTHTLSIGSTEFEVEVSDTPEERAHGLSGHDPLGDHQGMLFVFDTPYQYGFWMKDMKFNLDFIWIKDGKVVELTENVPAPSSDNPLPAVIVPKTLVDQVLEIPAGSIRTYGITLGDTLLLN